jgi:hypothetical protein
MKGYIRQDGKNGAAVARVPGVKVTLDLYPKVDGGGVRTGDYGVRLQIGPSFVDIPAGFEPILVAGSVSGEAGSGTNEGTMFLKSAVDVGEWPEEAAGLWAEFHGKMVHAVRWSGPNGITVPMDFFVALADTMLPVELYSKQWLGLYGPMEEPVDPDHPYGDTDGDGLLNWRDLNPNDGPGSGEVPPGDGSEDPEGSAGPA